MSSINYIYVVAITLYIYSITDCYALSQSEEVNQNEITYNDTHFKVTEDISDEIVDESLKVIDNLHSDNTKPRIQTRQFFSFKLTDVNITNSSYVSVISQNYPKPYPDEPATSEWLVGFGGGFGVELIVKDLDLDLDDDDYLLIIPGGIEYTDKNAVMLSHKIKEEKKFRLLHLDDLRIRFVTNEKTEPNTHKGFKIDVKRVGENAPTTEPPITEPPPQTIMAEDKAVLNLGGKTPEEFLNISETFKVELAKIAEIYCADNNITIAENLTVLDNVNYHLITACNIQWPDNENCVKVNYSISVFFDNETLEYELTTEHLNDLWWNYNNKINLEAMGIKTYVLPNDTVNFWTWMGISLGIIVWFFIVLYGIWRCRYFSEYNQSHDMRDSLVSMKKSDVSLFPIPHQSVPPLFGYDAFASDEKFWYEDMPPEYSEEVSPPFKGRGENNLSFIRDNELFNLDSDEEIIMSLPDQMKDQESRKQQHDEDVDQNESYL